jgi:hypothetical protein
MRCNGPGGKRIGLGLFYIGPTDLHVNKSALPTGPGRAEMPLGAVSVS